MDLNGDGIRDILSGSYSRSERPMAGLFQVLWGQKDGSFTRAQTLTGTDGEPLVIPAGEDSVTDAICTRPTAVDWDGDGDLDLVVGNFKGTFFIFTGEGKGAGEGKGRFNPKCTLLLGADGEPLRVNGAHSDPFIVDFDGDGDLDIVSGSGSGGVQWSQNTAGQGNTPALKPFAVLIEPPAERNRISSDPPTRPNDSLRVWVDDINADGKLDLLVGDRVTVTTRPPGLTQEQAEQKKAQWQEAYDAAMQALRTADDAEARTQAMKNLRAMYEKRNAFINEDRTGFVWLYLRK